MASVAIPIVGYVSISYFTDFGNEGSRRMHRYHGVLVVKAVTGIARSDISYTQETKRNRQMSFNHTYSRCRVRLTPLARTESKRVV